MSQLQNQEGGVLPKSNKPSASARVTKSLKVKSAIQKPKQEESPVPMQIDDLSASSVTSSPQDASMVLLRTGSRVRVKPQAFVPGLVGPKKTRGPLTEEQKAARAAARAATLAAKAVQVVPVIPTQEQLDAVRKEQAIVARANEIIAQQMEVESKRPSRKAKSEQEAKSRWNVAYEQAKRELAKEKKEKKKAIVSEIDELADLIGQMTTLRPSVVPVPMGQPMHSSGHPIVGYDPRDGWPLGVNPATGNVERFATRDGGKKKRTYKKKSQKGGEVEGAVAENEKSLPAPVDQAGGKKKRAKKQNK